MKKHHIQAGIVFILLALVFGFFLYKDSCVYKECYVEAGVAVTAKDFMKNNAEEVAFLDGSDSVDTSNPGDYLIELKSGYFTYESTLHVTDTIAPTAQAVDVNLELGENCEAEDFVAEITDVTEVEVAFAAEPDFTQAGKQEVEISLTDQGNNATIINAQLYISKVLEEITVEVGEQPPALQDFVIECEEAEFISDINGFDYMTPADETVTLKVDGIVYDVVMHIVDTTPPIVEMRDVYGYMLVERTAEEFVTSVEDSTEVTYSFKKAPDLNMAGEQIVEVDVTDAGGNVTTESAKLILAEDTEAPVIRGVADINVIIGNPVSYKKNVTITDNCPDGLLLTVDSSAVNLNAEGTYPVTYTLKDLAGNEVTASANVIVRPMVYDENEVYALADAVLARIITPEMTPTQKLQAIYDYNKTHIAYINHSEKESWVRAAYEGLAEGKGDCYVYACTAKVLLTRAGITNMDIEKIPAKTRHYWNLVDIGEGWYHFDTTPRKDKPTIFMWTEAQLMDYSAKHYNSHNYDHSLYPVVN